MNADDYKEHTKLRDRDDVHDNMQPVKKTQEEEQQRTNKAKTAETVNELTAANAATQATVAALAAENADIKALLTQLVQLQVKSTIVTAKATETDTEPNNKPKTEPKTEPTPKLTTEPTTETRIEQYTELERMGVLQTRDSTATNSYDLPVTMHTTLFTELENINALSYTDFLQHSNSDQRRTVDPFSPYIYYKKMIKETSSSASNTSSSRKHLLPRTRPAPRHCL